MIVYHGLPENLYRFRPGPGSYLACLGRISPEKGVDRAIAIARQVGIPLRIAAKVDRADQEYFDTVIAPLLNDPLVDYIGEIGDDRKEEFLGNGSVPDVMEEGRTGFIGRELDDAVEAVRRVPQLSRARCREVFEERFTSARMARDYFDVYARLIAQPTRRVA